MAREHLTRNATGKSEVRCTLCTRLLRGAQHESRAAGQWIV